MELGNLAQWAGAVASTAAVIVALFKESLVSRLRRPRLIVAPIEPPHCHKLPVRYEIMRTAPTLVVTEGYYFRLWVGNEGRTRAADVQVFAARLFRRGADGDFVEDKQFLPMNLLWSHEDEPYAQGISPKMGKHCNLGRIIRPAERPPDDDLPGVPSTETVFSLFLEVRPSSLSHLLRPGVYRLELRIAAANSKPTTKILEITQTGKWFDDEGEMFRDGVGFRFV